MLSDIPDKLKEKLDDASKYLKYLKEEIPLKLQLSGMEAKDAWKGLQQQLDELQGNLERFSSKAQNRVEQADLQVHLALMEAQDRWEMLQDSLRNLISNLKSKEQSLSVKFDQVKVQSRLAKMEAKDAIEERVEQVKGKFRGSREALLAGSEEIAAQLKKSLANLKESLMK